MSSGRKFGEWGLGFGLCLGVAWAEEVNRVERTRWEPETRVEQALLAIGPAVALGTRPHGEIPTADGRRLTLDYVAVQVGRDGLLVAGLRLSAADASPLYLDDDEPRRLVSELRKAERIGDGPAGYEAGPVWVRSVGDVVFELPGRGRGDPLLLIRWPNRGQTAASVPVALNREGYERLIALLSLADAELRRLGR